MDLKQFVDIVETMALQHDYPGFDVRSLNLGLPEKVVNAPMKLFLEAMRQDSTVVKLAALRWFWERPGASKRCQDSIAALLHDDDEWVRLESARTLGRIDSAGEPIAIAVAGLLQDGSSLVRQAAAKSCGKLGIKSPAVIECLIRAAKDPDRQVSWKAQKALRQLGAYQTN